MMNINSYINRVYSNPFAYKSTAKISEKNVSFSGDNNKEEHRSRPVLKRFIPYAIAGLVTIGGVNSCNETNGISAVSDLHNTKVEYSNVKQETKDSLDLTINRIKSKLNADNDFLKDVEINVTKRYKDMDDNHSFKTFLKEQWNTKNDKGVSFYSDNNIKRIIIVQEKAHDNDADKSLSAVAGLGYSSIPPLRHSLVHEMGHQFDEYFGHDHDAEFAKKWDNIILHKEKDAGQNPYSYETTPEEDEVEINYKYNSGLSDKEDFEKALLKDLQYIAKVKKHNPDRLACNIEYYTQDIDLDKPITLDDVDFADYARSEVYANLFAYAMGENDGDKVDFVDNFKNSYKIVQRDINNHLKMRNLAE